MKTQAATSGVEPIKFWTVKDCAKFLGVSEDWVYRRAEAKEMPGYLFASKWRFDPVLVRAWYDGHSIKKAVGA